MEKKAGDIAAECVGVDDVLMVAAAVARVNQREKHGSADAADEAADSNPVRQRLMHMLGLTMPPRTASTATQTAANGLHSAGTQTDHASASAGTSASSSYRYTRY